MVTDADRTPEKKSYRAPTLRKFELTEGERTELQKSDDPMALLFTLRPEIKTGKFGV